MAELKVEKAQPSAKHRMVRPFWDFLPYRGTPFMLIRNFMDELDRSMGKLRKAQAETEWIPAIECKTQNGDLMVSAELPGIKKEDLKVEVTDEALILEGDRKHEETEESEGYYRSERAYGHFYRYIGLPEGAKTDEVKAELGDGVLTITVPISEKKDNRRQIAVQAGKQ